MIAGDVQPGFELVADAFTRNFEKGGDVGAACAVYVEGRKVVDLWGGEADPATGAPWQEDTIVPVFSSTKGATAACANLLLDRGALVLDEPVATYWPAFAANGKDQVTVRWALCHKAGVPVLDRRVSIDDIVGWDAVVAAVAEQAPVWEPGTKHGYHALTWGWIIGELVRRVTDRSLGTFFHDEFARPFALSWWIGLPAEEEHRVAPLLPYPGGATAASGAERTSLMARSMAMLRAPRDFNDPAVRAAEIPAGNGIADARSMARFYDLLTSDESPISRRQLDEARVSQTSGPDAVLSLPGLPAMELTFGLGFMVASPWCRFGVPGAFGHNGAGGSAAFGDPANRVGFGYAMNQMMGAGDQRASRLVRAVYKSMGVEAPYT